MRKQKHLTVVMGLMLMSLTALIAQPKLEFRNRDIPKAQIQSYFVADGLVSPNWQLGEKPIYDRLNEGQIVLIDLLKTNQEQKSDAFDQLPKDRLSKIVLLSDGKTKSDIPQLAIDALLDKTLDSLFKGNANAHFVAIFPNKQVKYLNINELPSLFELGQDKLQVAIRYELFVNHVKCTNINDASITIRAKEGAEPYAYQWNTGQTTDKIDKLSGGKYICIITDALGNKTITDSISVNTPPKLTVNITKKSQMQEEAFEVKTVCMGGIAPFEFRWLKDTTAFSSEKDVAHLQDGIYKLLVRDALGCKYDYPLVVGQPANLKESGLAYAATVYPNPSSGKISLHLNDPLYNSAIEVLDDIGRKVYQTKITTPDTTLDLSFLSDGIYNINISNALGSLNKKIIIKK